jgi:hypothetical protein
LVMLVFEFLASVLGPTFYEKSTHLPSATDLGEWFQLKAK